MSSFKKSLPKRKYRERSQPEHRKHLGLLEKKQDYQLRAADTHRKQKALEILREKALNKNSDEFYFGMEHTRIIAGKHRREEGEADGQLVKKKKDLDGNLLTMKVQNKHARHMQLQSGLHLIDAPAPNKHIIFVKDKARVENFDLAEHFDTVPELVDKKSNRLKKKQLEEVELHEVGEADGYKELEELLKEELLLEKSLEENLLTKKLRGPDKYKVIDEENKVYKWFRERKR